jgi:trigger factor
MKVNAEVLEANKVELDIEVDAQELNQAVDRAYRKLVKTANIAGFRKGKAPRLIFERHYGKGVLYEEAFDDLFPDVYAQAVKDAGVEPVDQPDVNIKQMEEGKPLLFKARVIVKPEVTLGDYAGVSVRRETATVTPEEVDFQIEALRERQAQLVPVEGPIERGMFATIDFVGTTDGKDTDGKEFPGSSVKGYTLEVGSGRFIAGFEDQVVGLAKGETKDITSKFPEDHPEKDLAGKEALFRTTVTEIKKKQLPEINDDLAKSVGSLQTVEELRTDIQNRLLEAKERQMKREHENQVIAKVVEMSTVNIPTVMIDRRSDEMFQNLLERLHARKISLDEYLKGTGQELDALRNEMKESATRNVKTNLVIEAVAKKEKIDAAQEEIDDQVSSLSAVYKQKPEIIRTLLMSRGGAERLADSIVSDKTIAMLAGKANANAGSEPAPAVAEGTSEPAEETPEADKAAAESAVGATEPMEAGPEPPAGETSLAGVEAKPIKAQGG